MQGRLHVDSLKSTGNGPGRSTRSAAKFEKLRTNFQSNHFGWNSSAVNFCYFASKKQIEKNQGAKVQLLEV